MHSITFLDGSGDVTISWTDDNKAEVLALIRRKMDQGYSFFIIERTMLGLKKTKKQIDSVDPLQKKTSVILNDEEGADFLQEMLVGQSLKGAMPEELDDPLVAELLKVKKIIVDSQQQLKSAALTKREKKPEVIAQSNTVAIRPIVGG